MADVVVTTTGRHVHRWFAWAEFASRGTPVPGKSREGLHQLVDLVLVPLRHEFGPCIVTSGFRTVGHNIAVGGATYSRHQYDSFPTEPAVDVRFAQGRPKDWAAAAEHLLSYRGGIGTYTGHVHLDRRRGRARWSG